MDNAPSRDALFIARQRVILYYLPRGLSSPEGFIIWQQFRCLVGTLPYTCPEMRTKFLLWSVAIEESRHVRRDHFGIDRARRCSYLDRQFVFIRGIWIMPYGRTFLLLCSVVIKENRRARRRDIISELIMRNMVVKWDDDIDVMLILIFCREGFFSLGYACRAAAIVP